MKPYPSYKESGVEWIGEIPNDWSIKKVKYLFSNEKNQISVKEFEDNELIHYSIPNVQEFGKGQLENGGDIDSSKLLLNGNELLVSRLNPRKRTVCISEPDTEHMILGSGEFIVLVPNGMNLKYCYYQFVTDGMTQNLDSLVESVTKSHQRVRPERVFNTLYIEPPKDEIEQIVSFIDYKTQKIDELIEKTERKIELLKEKRTSLINHCVTKGLPAAGLPAIHDQAGSRTEERAGRNVKMKDSGVPACQSNGAGREWIGEIPSVWTIKKVSYLCNDMISGPFGSSLKKEFYTKTGYKIYGQEQVIKDDFEYGDYFISEEKFEELKRCEIFTNDILISCVGTFGKISIVPEKFIRGIINPRLLKITPNELIKPNYFLILLRSYMSFSQFESLSRGGTMGVINLDILRQLKFPIPPLSEQDRIVEYLDEQTQKIDTTIEKETQRIELLKEYRQSLISEVVTGKIDVRDWKE